MFQNRAFRVLGNLILLVVLCTGQVAAKEEVLLKDSPKDKSQYNFVDRTGWLAILWKDNRDGNPIPSVYTLTDDNGRLAFLSIDEELATPQGDVLALNRQRVRVKGIETLPLAHVGGPEKIQVTSIFPETVQNISDPKAVTGSKPFVSIMCKFADVTAEPKNLSYFQGMYSSVYPGIDHYWREVSYNNMNVSGSFAVGWYTLPQPRSYYVYNGVLDFDRAAVDCTSVADAVVDFAPIYGINLIFNDELDGYAWGGGHFLTLDGTSKVWPMTWEPPWGFDDVTVMSHEMGHAFGLPHSASVYGYEYPYGDRWDIMGEGWLDCSRSTHPTYGCLAQHTISYHKDLLGWIPANEKFIVGPNTDATVTLEQLALPATSNYKMIQIPIGGLNHFYTLEVRRRVGYDVKLPEQGIVIHEVAPYYSTTRPEPAHVLDANGNGDPWDAGSIWSVGGTFSDPTIGLTVSIVSATATGFQVRIQCDCAPTEPPSTPLNLRVTGTTSTSVSIAWDDVLFESGYNIYKWDGVSQFIYLASVDSDITTFTDGMLSCGSSAWYEVSAYNSAGESPHTGWVQDDTTLCAPTAFGKSNPTNGATNQPTTLNLSWSPSSGATSYEYCYGTTNPCTNWLPNNEDTSKTLSGLLNDTTYYWHVRAINAGGTTYSNGANTSFWSFTTAPSAGLFNCFTVSEIPLEECQALATLYTATSGASWTNHTNWLQTNTPCTWFGITCNGGHVTQLALDSNNLTGNLPSGLDSFSQLTLLDLSDNALTDSIPPELGNLAALQTLNLRWNYLTGTIPTDLEYLDNIVDLNLNGNYLDGPIPIELGQLTSLQVLDLGQNELTGGIPTQIGSLTSVQELDLSSNELTGIIPTEIGNLVSLRYLQLDFNSLSGEFPSSITNLTQLVSFQFDCELTSSDPAVIAFLDTVAPDWQNQICLPEGSIVTISGNTGAPGVILNYTDGTPRTATADGNGYYSFEVTYDWNGAVIPSKPGYTFAPACRDYRWATVNGNRINQDYTASAAPPIPDTSGITTRASVSSSELQGNCTSGWSSISADGTYVAFQSSANNLVADDTNGWPDVFVRDMQTGETTRVSVDSNGNEGNASSGPGLDLWTSGPSISADGRFVAFESLASNLVSGDTNNSEDVFVHDRDTGATIRVSIDSDGMEGNDHSYSASISGNGRYVAFVSDASNLVTNDTNFSADVFVYDMVSGVTSRVSVDSNGMEGDDDSWDGWSPSLSADGQLVAFGSGATNLVPNDTNDSEDIFVHDMQTGETRRASVNSSGEEGDDFSYRPSISADGTQVAFASYSENLWTQPTYNVNTFVHNLQTGQTDLVSVGTDGNASGPSISFSISADGRYVAFDSFSSRIIDGDTNRHQDVFVRDMQTGVTTRVSVDSNWGEANDQSYWITISADGRYVAFSSHASNLTGTDTNEARDIYVVDYAALISPPAPFGKSTPIDAAINQSTSLTLSWNESEGATDYEYCIDITSSCTNWQTAGVNTSVDPPGLEANTTYYWQVRANNPNGTTDADESATAFWSFTTLPNPPASFGRISPSNGSVNQATSLTLSWSTSIGADSYDVCFGMDNPCTNWQPNGITTTWNVTGLANGATYYWHVRANNAGGSTYANGSQTAFWSFTTAPDLPDAFGKISPADGAINQFTSPTLMWAASSGATSYEYCLITDVNVPCTDWLDSASTSKTVSLVGGVTYYWQVRAVNADGNTEADAGEWWSFTTTTNPGLPPAPILIEPADGEHIMTNRPLFSWEPVDTAFRYLIEVAADPAFKRKVISTSTTTTSYLPRVDLHANMTFYWRVRAKNAVGVGPYSEVFTLTTGPTPSTPTLRIPVTTSLSFTQRPSFDWNNSTLPTGATFENYQIQIALDDTFEGPVIDETTTPNDVTDSDYIPTDDLELATTYYWRVRAWNAGGYHSGWSIVRSVRISYPRPTLIGPSGSVASLRPTFTWDLVAGATSYKIQVSTTPTFRRTAVNVTVYTNSYTMTKDLLPGTTYYWRVQALGAFGPGPWSIYFTITTP